MKRFLSLLFLVAQFLYAADTRQPPPQEEHIELQKQILHLMLGPATDYSAVTPPTLSPEYEQAKKTMEQRGFESQEKSFEFFDAIQKTEKEEKQKRITLFAQWISHRIGYTTSSGMIATADPLMQMGILSDKLIQFTVNGLSLMQPGIVASEPHRSSFHTLLVRVEKAYQLQKEHNLPLITKDFYDTYYRLYRYDVKKPLSQWDTPLDRDGIKLFHNAFNTQYMNTDVPLIKKEVYTYIKQCLHPQQ